MLVRGLRKAEQQARLQAKQKGPQKRNPWAEGQETIEGPHLEASQGVTAVAGGGKETVTDYTCQPQDYHGSGCLGFMYVQSEALQVGTGVGMGQNLLIRFTGQFNTYFNLT